MAITKAGLLVLCNNNLERSETDIDNAIKRVIGKINGKGNFLVETKNTDTISSTSTTVAYPTGFKSLNYIRLQRSNNSVTPYLIKKSYGEYLNALSNGVGGTPDSYTGWNSNFYFYPVPSDDFTVEITYFKNHPQDADTIEYDETKFSTVMESGVTFEVANRYGLTDQINLWGQRYADDLRDVKQFNINPVYNTQWSRF